MSDTPSGTHSPAVFVALANPRTARSLMRVGLALAGARHAPLIAISVAPMSTGTGHHAETTPAMRRLRGLVHRMVEMAAAHGHQVTGIVRAARSVQEGLTEAVGEEMGRLANGEQVASESVPLLVVGWPAGEAIQSEPVGLIGILAAAPPCDVLFLRGRVGPRWQSIMLAQRGGAHTRLAQQVALDLARGRSEAADRAAVTVTALHVVPRYLDQAQTALEAAAFSAHWTRDEPGMTPRVVQAASSPTAIVRESRQQDLLVLDAAMTARAYPLPLGRTAHEVVEAARSAVLVAKAYAGEVIRDGQQKRARPWWVAARGTPSVGPDVLQDEGLSTSVPGVQDHGGGQPSFGAPAAPGAEAAGATFPPPDRWFAERTYGAREFANAAELAALKQRLGLTVGVLLLTSDDSESGEEMIGPLIRAIHAELGAGGAAHLVDEVLLIDSVSADGTLALARSLGATALDSREVLRAAGSFRGRGEALWKALGVTRSDILVSLNPAVPAGAARAVCALAGPLLHDANLHLIVGFHGQALRASIPSTEMPAELLARPLLNLLFPELSGLITPVPGDIAARTSTLRRLPIVGGECVEVGLLLDVLRRHGLDALAQIDLEGRPARSYEPWMQSRFAFALAQVVLHRLDQIHTEVRLLGPMHHILRLPYLQAGRYVLEATDMPEIERPPFDDWLAEHGPVVDRR